MKIFSLTLFTNDSVYETLEDTDFDEILFKYLNFNTVFENIYNRGIRLPLRLELKCDNQLIATVSDNYIIAPINVKNLVDVGDSNLESLDLATQVCYYLMHQDFNQLSDVIEDVISTSNLSPFMVVSVIKDKHNVCIACDDLVWNDIPLTDIKFKGGSEGILFLNGDTLLYTFKYEDITCLGSLSFIKNYPPMEIVFDKKDLN